MRTTLILLLVLCGLSGIAFAANMPAPDADASEWIKALYVAATKGEWKVVAGLVLLGITFVLRTWGAKYIGWFASRTGGMVLSFICSLGATIGLALGAGAPIKFATVAAAFGTAATAAGMWEWLKHYVPKVDAKNEATKAAAAAKNAPVNQ